jgi:hypothetical protein
MQRRTFLGTSALAGLGTFLPYEPLTGENAQPPLTVPVPDHSWRLWLDPEAEWKSDPIYLPEDVVLNNLPSNAPTSGWQVLNTTQGIPVKLPPAVEQFYWGLQGLRPYRDEYKFEADDPAVKNGNYLGVS